MLPTQPVANTPWIDLSPAQQVSGRLATLSLFDRHHPFLRCIVRRTREYLEKAINPQTNTPYLLPVAVLLHGDDNLYPGSASADEVKPFHAFDERYSRVEDVSGWDECARVLNRREKLDVLRRGWVS